MNINFKEVIKHTSNYGEINSESKFWNDYEEMGDDLSNYKIIKIKIYKGIYKEKEAIFGISYTLKNRLTGEIKPEIIHKGSMNFLEVKEFVIKGDDYLTDFHIRFPEKGDYISHLGFSTNKKDHFLFGTNDGEDKKINSNGGKNIIIGTFGNTNEKLDSMGCFYISKKDYIMKTSLLSLIILRVKIKNDEKFKEEWNKKYKELPIEYQYLWKAVILPDSSFYQILDYCFL